MTNSTAQRAYESYLDEFEPKDQTAWAELSQTEKLRWEIAAEKMEQAMEAFVDIGLANLVRDFVTNLKAYPADYNPGEPSAVTPHTLTPAEEGRLAAKTVNLTLDDNPYLSERKVMDNPAAIQWYFAFREEDKQCEFISPPVGGISPVVSPETPKPAASAAAEPESVLRPAPDKLQQIADVILRHSGGCADAGPRRALPMESDDPTDCAACTQAAYKRIVNIVKGDAGLGHSANPASVLRDCMELAGFDTDLETFKAVEAALAQEAPVGFAEADARSWDREADASYRAHEEKAGRAQHVRAYEMPKIDEGSEFYKQATIRVPMEGSTWNSGAHDYQLKGEPEHQDDDDVIGRRHSDPVTKHAFVQSADQSMALCSTCGYPKSHECHTVEEFICRSCGTVNEGQHILPVDAKTREYAGPAYWLCRCGAKTEVEE